MPELTPAATAARIAQNERLRNERLADVQWMYDGGECLSGAAARLGITTEGLRAWCRRHAPQLGLALAAREPVSDVQQKRWTA